MNTAVDDLSNNGAIVIGAKQLSRAVRNNDGTVEIVFSKHNTQNQLQSYRDISPPVKVPSQPKLPRQQPTSTLPFKMIVSESARRADECEDANLPRTEQPSSLENFFHFPSFMDKNFMKRDLLAYGEYVKKPRKRSRVANIIENTMPDGETRVVKEMQQCVTSLYQDPMKKGPRMTSGSEAASCDTFEHPYRLENFIKSKSSRNDKQDARFNRCFSKDGQKMLPSDISSEPKVGKFRLSVLDSDYDEDYNEDRNKKFIFFENYKNSFEDEIEGCPSRNARSSFQPKGFGNHELYMESAIGEDHSTYSYVSSNSFIQTADKCRQKEYEQNNLFNLRPNFQKNNERVPYNITNMQTYTAGSNASLHFNTTLSKFADVSKDYEVFTRRNPKESQTNTLPTNNEETKQSSPVEPDDIEQIQKNKLGVIEYDSESIVSSSSPVRALTPDQESTLID